MVGARRPSALEKLRTDLETKNGQPLFLIADERDRAAEIAFYLRDKRTEGPGHPPVYIVESQDLENQFSFWPRYDEFVEQPSLPAASPNEVYTEENGVNLFVDRSALYIQEGATATRAAQYSRRISIGRARCDNRIAAVRYKRADMADFSLPQLPDAAVMNCACCFRSRSSLQRGRERSRFAGGTALRSQPVSITKSFLSTMARSIARSSESRLTNGCG